MIKKNDKKWKRIVKKECKNNDLKNNDKKL